MPPIRLRPLITAFAVLATGLLPCPTRPAPSEGPPVQLVETVPVETALGNPELPSALAVWLDMIRGARTSVDLEQMYLSHWPGEPTGPVLDALGAAARRGVRVRLILSAEMYQTYPAPADSLAGLPGCEVRRLDMRRLTGAGIQHAKFFVIDGQQLFVGSQNFDWRALKHIHELGVRIRDARIAGLFLGVFESDWEAAEPVAKGASAGDAAAGAPEATRAPRAAPGAPGPARANALPAATLVRPDTLPALPVRLVQAPGDTVAVWVSFSPRGHIPDPSLWDLDALVRLLDGARGEAVVQLLSYGVGREAGRDTTLEAALRRAAARGVKVRLLVSDWQADNARIGDLQRLATIPNVEARLSVVPEWSGGYIPFARVEHCKYLVVDTLWTWVGTSNWEPDYFHRSRNAAVTLLSRPLASQALRVFETSWRSPTAKVVREGERYEPRIHRETPPPGKKAYGR